MKTTSKRIYDFPKLHFRSSDRETRREKEDFGGKFLFFPPWTSSAWEGKVIIRKSFFPMISQQPHLMIAVIVVMYHQVKHNFNHNHLWLNKSWWLLMTEDWVERDSLVFLNLVSQIDYFNLGKIDHSLLDHALNRMKILSLTWYVEVRSKSRDLVSILMIHSPMIALWLEMMDTIRRFPFDSTRWADHNPSVETGKSWKLLLTLSLRGTMTSVRLEWFGLLTSAVASRDKEWSELKIDHLLIS